MCCNGFLYYTSTVSYYKYNWVCSYYQVIHIAVTCKSSKHAWFLIPLIDEMSTLYTIAVGQASILVFT